MDFSSILQASYQLQSLSARNEVLLNQLSTGQKVNSPADNPSAFYRINRLQSQLNSYSTYLDQMNEGNSVLSLVTDSVGSQMELLGQMQDLAEQAQDNSLSSDERTSLQDQMTQYQTELDQIVSQTTFDGTSSLLDGQYASTPFSINSGPGQTFDLYIPATDTASLGVDGSLSLSSKSNAKTTADTIGDAIDQLQTVQGSFGANQFILQSRQSLTENTQTVLQQLVDNYQEVDPVQVTAELNRNQLLQQYSLAAIASLQQADQTMFRYLFPYG
jgi:flagellin